jgi:RNA polymerase sigma-70 factor (ECF subfamily)
MDNGESSYRRFLEGDDSGFIEIIRDYKDGLILFLHSMTRDYALAEELCEDTFVRLAVKKPKFNGRCAFKTFLYAIGRRVAADNLRRMSRREILSLEALSEEGFDPPADEDVSESYLKDERKLIVHRALGRLTPTHRQVLWLVYFENLSIKEAADVLGKTVHATDSLIYRARLSMKAQLEKEGITNEDL